MDKVYIVNGETIGFEDTYSAIAGVHTTEEGARKRMREEIDSRCVGIKDQFEEQFNDEDYAEDFEDYETFEEFWTDWVNSNFVTMDYWRYSDETDFTYVVTIVTRKVED
ncbi:MAG: hypothetical protein J6Q39_02985 [Bacteroidales bacterium]|nr:hypothetical protein [Bacteroidales bacterium]